MRCNRFVFYKGEPISARPARPLAGVLPGCNPSALHASAWLTIIGHSDCVGSWFYFEETRRISLPALLRTEKALQIRAYRFGFTKEYLYITSTPNYGIVFTWRKQPEQGVYGPEYAARKQLHSQKCSEYHNRRVDAKVKVKGSRKFRFNKTRRECADDGHDSACSDLKREIQQL